MTLDLKLTVREAVGGGRPARDRATLTAPGRDVPDRFDLLGASRVAPPVNLALGERFAFGAAAPDVLTDDTGYEAPAAYFSRLHDVYLFLEWGAAMTARGEIWGDSVVTARFKSPDLDQLPGAYRAGDQTMMTWPLPRAYRRLEGVHLSLQHWAGQNYGHFLFDCLLSAALLRTEIQRREIGLVSRPLAGWQYELLALLGIPPEYVTVIDDDVCLCAALLVPSFHRNNVDQPSPLTRRMADLLCRNYWRLADEATVLAHHRALIDRGPARRGSRLFISRRGVRTRMMDNEDELAAALIRLGFDVIQPESLSVMEQIGRFQSARLIVSEIGAGLSNILFAPAGCTVIEIIPEIKPSQWIRNLCGLLGHAWRVVYAPVPESGRQPVVIDGVTYDNLVFHYSAPVDAVLEAVATSLID